MLAASAEVRRQAHVLHVAIMVALCVALAIAAKDALFGSYYRAVLTLSVSVPLALTLVLLRTSLGLRWSSHYLLVVSVVSLHTRLALDPHGSQLVIAICGLGIIATYLISPRGGAAWTVVGVGLAALNAVRLSMLDSPETEAAWALAIVAGPIGFMSVAGESARRVAAEAASAAHLRIDEGRDRVRLLAERAFPGIIEVTPGQIHYASTGVRELLGYTAEEFASQGLDRYVHPDDFWPVVEKLHANPSRVAQVEARLRHARGHWTWIAAFAIPDPGQPGDDRWIFAARDVESERRERESGLQANRLEGVGLLAAGVAHDFNNLLTVISGNAEFLPPSAERDQILQTTGEAAGLTRQLLAFGTKQPHELQNLDLCELVNKLAPILRSLVGEEIELRIEAQAAPCPVRVDPTQIDQIILNLVTNARDAMSAGGILEVEVLSEGGTGSDESGGELLPGGSVCLTVRDDGVGMDASTLTHAFDPFFTTKSGGRGSGLGLASAYGIARQMGGQLRLESVAGKGTHATLLLPKAARLDLSNHSSAGPCDDTARYGGVLVVEDDPRIRSLICRAFREAGFDTLEAGDGAEALRIFEALVEPPALLVTDVVMPGMRGSAVADQMRGKLPELKILFVSGYSDVELGSWHEHDEAIAFLAKPFTAEQLIGRASTLLHSSVDKASA